MRSTSRARPAGDRARRTGPAALLCLAAALAAGATDAVAQSTNFVHAVSPSRQFIVYSHDHLLSSTLCAFAERVKRDWLGRLDLADAWRGPILIVVRDRDPAQAGEPAILRQAIPTQLHWRFQIDCFQPPPIEETALLSAIVEALCAEYAHRQRPLPRDGPPTVAPIPPWLVEGLAQSIHGQTDLMRMVANRSVNAGRPISAAGLLAVSAAPRHAAELELFRATALMFTESLLAIPHGKERLRDFLTTLADQPAGQDGFLRAYRDVFADERALEKWWAVELHWRTSLVAAQNLGLADTARQLDTVLSTALAVRPQPDADPETFMQPLDGLWRHYQAPWLAAVLTDKLHRLEALRAQAHPMYRPVIGAYTDAILWLQRKNITRFRRVLARADKARRDVDARAAQIAAYLDEVERGRGFSETSELFRDWFRTLDEFEHLQQRRQNPISDYLDGFDR
jgi:hypothetical protein